MLPKKNGYKLLAHFRFYYVVYIYSLFKVCMYVCVCMAKNPSIIHITGIYISVYPSTQMYKVQIF